MRTGRLSGGALLAAMPFVAVVAACDQGAPVNPGPLPATANQPPVINAQPVSPALGIDEVSTFSIRVEVRDSSPGTTITGTIRDSHGDTGIADPNEPGTIDGDGRFRLRFKIPSEDDLEIAGRIISTGTDNFTHDVVVATGTVTTTPFAGRTFRLWREAPY